MNDKGDFHIKILKKEVKEKRTNFPGEEQKSKLKVCSKNKYASFMR